MIRVLIVDDSVFMRTVLIDLLGKDPSIEVVGTAEDGLQALKKIEELSPDVITLDIQMPKMNGIEMLEKLQSSEDPPKILMLSTLTSKDAELTKKGLELGADDFMLKPRNLGTVRGIEKELITKIKHLITIPKVSNKVTVEEIPAKRVVLIGSSAGGPPMLDIIVSALKPDLNAAVVITQHMPAGFTASLAQRLDRISPLEVKETANGDLLQNGRIYVSKGGFHTVISATLDNSGRKGGRITHSKAPPVHAVRPAVDKTFQSASKVFGPNTVAAILSGMGSDGGEGMAAIKESGGRTILVREEDCLVYGMARSALERDCVDKVLPLKSIPRDIMRTISNME
ncbi:chemotaxis-specific protein-glutamate methyltransferase CheB [Methanoplanus sp. FWC-SCC4]|uniref:Protein-glutamate methylesterase/protein-glutamine glutaminase n=1 Tax=Methanochimaera problematica TaxID=2609417 RepID=A0AA97I3J1_9EURY|nr:chemotaxis-specific protein-glutamate methyltransferase CheB [Methanoplanus sp. FWC-SCC4]WOF15614.1 chemotaxis-specific protein-glutamate methyltransferase CheB [Methanoplanus sp. FWC-SCC4]